jgi:hypothetical protein
MRHFEIYFVNLEFLPAPIEFPDGESKLYFETSEYQLSTGRLPEHCQEERRIISVHIRILLYVRDRG